jgi:hypothetical protein
MWAGCLAPMAVVFVDRPTIFVAICNGMGDADSLRLRCESNFRMQHFVRRSTYAPFRRFSGDVPRGFLQSLSAALHGALGSYLCYAFHESGADIMACPPCSSGLRMWGFLQEKAVEATTKQKEEKRKKPKPEEQEGMPQRQQCPLEKRRGDRNSKWGFFLLMFPFPISGFYDCFFLSRKVLISHDMNGCDTCSLDYITSGSCL